MKKILALSLAAVVALLALAGPATAAKLPWRNEPAWKTTHRNADYGRAVQAVLGLEKTPTVTCYKGQQWRRATRKHGQGLSVLGFVASKNPNQIHLSQYICRTLDEMTYLDFRSVGYRPAIAVDTLIHEGIHVYDRRDGATNFSEAQTACFALQKLRETALALTGDADYADRLAAQRAADYELNDLNYWSPACYDGGRLDLSPDDSTWP